MATFKIEPIKTQTKDGYPARITGINTDPCDCFTGEIDSPSGGTISVDWNINGIARGKTCGCNLDTGTSEFKEAKECLSIFK